MKQINRPEFYKDKRKKILYEVPITQIMDAFNLNFSLGSAVTYIIRAGFNDGEPALEALEKAIWYLENEIQRHKLESGEGA